MNQWLQWTSLIANISTALGIIGFVAIYYSHQQNQKQFNFTVMLSCIERFQELLPITRNDEIDLSKLKKYIDLTSEEFFYFQREYIPKQVMVEWLDSIVDNFPIYKKNYKEPLNYAHINFKTIHDLDLLDSFPRLKKAFTINGFEGLDQIQYSNWKENKSLRIRLITEVCKNLDIHVKTKHFKEALMD